MTKPLSQLIVETARQYVGKEEIPGNRGFRDPDFEREMRTLGTWQPPWAWCACFARLVWVKAMDAAGWTEAEQRAIYRCLFPGVLRTRNAFRESYPSLWSNRPAVGALVVWRNGNTEFGHIGIVTAVHANGSFSTIEGNTSETNDREGQGVEAKIRHGNISEKLRLVGFVLPPARPVVTPKPAPVESKADYAARLAEQNKPATPNPPAPAPQKPAVTWSERPDWSMAKHEVIQAQARGEMTSAEAEAAMKQIGPQPKPLAGWRGWVGGLTGTGLIAALYQFGAWLAAHRLEIAVWMTLAGVVILIGMGMRKGVRA